MGLFWKKNGGTAGEAAPAAPAPAGWTLGAFGKHPGWDDHIDDLALNAGALVEAKQILYVNGIGRQIDLGAWDALEEAQRTEGFQHFFIWRRGAQWMLGRLWSSSDGKGRTRYPMVACGLYHGPDVVEAARRAHGALQEVERECRSVRTADEVRAALARHQESFRASLEGGNGSHATPDDDALLKKICGLLGEEAWLRTLYQIHTQMSCYARGGAGGTTRGPLPRPQQIRLPVAPECALESVLFWMRFFIHYTGRSSPLLLAAPDDRPWVDVTLGQPGEQEFFSLRASSRSVPPASEIPYALDEAFRVLARATLEAFKKQERSEFAALEPARPEGDTVTERFFKSKLFGRS